MLDFEPWARHSHLARRWPWGLRRARSASPPAGQCWFLLCSQGEPVFGQILTISFYS